MLNQSFEPRDLLIVLLLVVLEGLLSLDNALVLGLLAKKLPEHLRSKALTYGLVGSFIFRLIAIAAAAWLLEWRIVKLLGGLYLVYIAVKHLFFEHDKKPAATEQTATTPTDDAATVKSATDWAFWSVVGSIELTDVAFAVDSVLAGIALVGPAPQGDENKWHPKLWVILIGGMLGVLMMRFAAFGFIRLLEKFPRFEVSAYLLVALVGLKLTADWYFNATEHRLNFESPTSLAFWVFWSLMAACIAVGFIPQRKIVAAY